ncbi:MAG: hypothetical protein FJ137_01460 [Deltaproteobacteria bacterium]|nr:hypothetical protein [Deltaproteobacteria bacterium]
MIAQTHRYAGSNPHPENGLRRGRSCSALAVGVVGLLGFVGVGCAKEPDALDFGAARAAKPPPPPTAVFEGPRAAIPPVHASGIGTNLGELRDWGADRPFLDVFKQSRTWISTSGDTWDDGRPLELDARGNVKRLGLGQAARSLVLWGDDVDFPAGGYRVTWQGTGELDFWPQGGSASSTKTGSFTLAADPARGGLAVTITKTDPNDPIRDIRVLVPGADPAERWNGSFLKRLEGYGTLRFMDWMNTNDGTLVAAGDRPVEADVRYTTKGVPVEVIADLCNRLRTACWVNVGHTWSDGLVEATAAVLRDRLDPTLRLYVEHGNEVWNGIFPVAEFAKKAGIAAELARDPFEAQLRFHARRTAQVQAFFDRVFSASNPAGKARVVRVLGGWAVNAWSTGVMLDQLKKDGAVVDVVAIAPYFGGDLGEPAQQAAVRAMQLPALMRRLEQSVDEATATLKEQKAVCDKHKVGLVAYEGGQHLAGIGPVAQDAVVNKLFDAANADPAMKVLYLRYLKGWTNAGGGLFVHYNSTQRDSRFGRWGALTSMTQPRDKAPKFDALSTFAESTPRWY